MTSARRFIIEADGGSRGNPGPAGYGTVVRDAETGEVLHEEARSLGTTTNNVAEYEGLLAGLRAVSMLDPQADVVVRMDSKLVVEQMRGTWRVKHEGLRPLASEAARLIRGLGSVEFSWIPREENRAADRLANEAMDEAAAGREWTPREPAASLVDAPVDDGAGPTRDMGDAERAVASGNRLSGNRLSGWMAAPAPPATTVLLRHGQTPLSVEKRFSGRGDAMLTEVGEAQVAATAARLARRGGVAAVIASPLRRTRRTAEVVAKELDLDVLIDDDLAETDFGGWEGLTFAEVQQRWPDDLAAWLADPTVAPPGGESFAATDERVRRARDRIVAEYSGRTVLVVSHVTPIKILVRMALDAPPTALYKLHLDLAALSEVDWYPDGPSVLRLYNDVSHLAD